MICPDHENFLVESSSEEEEESEDESESINSEKEEKHQTDSEDDSASPEQILKQSNNLDPKANGDVHNAQPDLGIKHASSDSSKDDGKSLILIFSIHVPSLTLLPFCRNSSKISLCRKANTRI